VTRTFPQVEHRARAGGQIRRASLATGESLAECLVWVMITILLSVAIAGFLVWIVTQIPMPPVFRNVIIGVACLCLIIWILQVFGLTSFGSPHWRH
jgi:hypothetical protein